MLTHRILDSATAINVMNPIMGF